jgi:hypothetical protein
MNSKVVVLAAILGCVFSASANAAVKVQWFQVSGTKADFNLAPCGTINCGSYLSDEIASTLDGNNLPVVGAANSGGLAEAPGAELSWWTIGNGVTGDGVTFIPLPVNQHMFPSQGNGNSDQNGFFQTAILTTKISVGPLGGDIIFGGDDDAFLALGNTVVGQLGGIHPPGTTVDVSVTVPGVYDLTMFYADRHVVDAFADLSFTGQISSVPETPVWAMMLLGFAGIGLAGYRRTRRAFST